MEWTFKYYTTGCVDSFYFQVTEPTQLTSSVTANTNYNGYNISCFDSSDGAIDIFMQQNGVLTRIK